MPGNTTQARPETRTATYIYGIVPADVQVEPGTPGVGDPAGDIRVIRHRDVAALVSDVETDRPLGHPQDLRAHEDLLDSAAADVPVLPLRFGSAVTDDDAVTRELLEPHHDEFARALRDLEGQAEFIVKGRYDESAILREVLADNDEAVELSQQIRDTSEDASRDARIRLGEIVGDAIGARRERDTRELGDALADHVAASVVREPAHEFDAVNIAFLAETGKADDVERALRRLSKDWGGRVALRLMGPLAPYDFVSAPAPGQ